MCILFIHVQTNSIYESIVRAHGLEIRNRSIRIEIDGPAWLKLLEWLVSDYFIIGTISFLLFGVNIKC